FSAPLYSRKQNIQGFPPQYGGPAYGHQPYPMAQQYPAQPDTVTVQPMVFVSAGPLANPVNDYLCYSIFTLLCCFWPLGVAALVYSISVSFFRFFVDSGALTPIHIAKFLTEPDPCQLNTCHCLLSSVNFIFFKITLATGNNYNLQAATYTLKMVK
uniref:Uncharacterized protein n=1 Tax=Stegastes partitus TaxID=144197 RepID=A0A3B5B129_9TELE